MKEQRVRRFFRVLLALFYIYAGYRHIVDPSPFLSITPQWVPSPDAVVFWTGVAEIAGGIALLQPFSKQVRVAGGVGLALYAICVWPANFNHLALDMTKADGGWGLSYHLPRLAAQPLIIWLALWSADIVDWPFRKRGT